MQTIAYRMQESMQLIRVRHPWQPYSKQFHRLVTTYQRFYFSNVQIIDSIMQSEVLWCSCSVLIVCILRGCSGLKVEGLDCKYLMIFLGIGWVSAAGLQEVRIVGWLLRSCRSCSLILAFMWIWWWNWDKIWFFFY